MNVRELFRRKLDGAEIIPDPSVNARLMRKLARREFIRFNPARFNAYYLGGIMAAAFTAVVLFSTDKENTDPQNNISGTDVTENVTGIKVFDVPEASVILRDQKEQQNVVAGKKSRDSRKKSDEGVILGRK